MVLRAKSVVINKVVLVVVFLLILGLYLYQQITTSIILNEKDRINIAVFAKTPYVFSYNVAKKIGIVVYFNPKAMVKVPGGYDWYKVGSLNLLAKIENKRPQILKQAFAELIGAPIDFVYYPKKAEVLEGNNKQLFREYYGEFNQRVLFSKQYSHSAHNLFDCLLLPRLTQVREDHLVFIDTNSLTIKENKRLYYHSAKLDTKLKGLFYRDVFLKNLTKAIILTKSSTYPKAQLILRQLEGCGIKVVEIRVNDKQKNKKCVVSGTKKQKKELQELGRLFNCQIRKQESSIINFYL